MSGPIDAVLSSTVEDAVKYDFCHYVPYLKRRKNSWKIVKGDEWVKNTLAKDGVIKSLKPKELKFNLSIKSKKLPLKAEIELLVVTEEEHIPVFPKSVDFRDDYNWKLEIVGKVVLLEEFLSSEINRALIYLLDNREWIELPIYLSEKQNFIRLATKLRERTFSTCSSCELRYACSILPGWI
ncbi:MAG: hypothetical protein H0Z28_11540 [Archaeoglobus sp.]|nr:hypothetical protein [Archaeoglobus sp.]